MYPSIKSNSITKEKVIELVGKELVEEVLAEQCEFTGRVIDECLEVSEMNAYADNNEFKIEVLYLIENTDLAECGGDLGNLDYTNYTFIVEEK